MDKDINVFIMDESNFFLTNNTNNTDDNNDNNDNNTNTNSNINNSNIPSHSQNIYQYNEKKIKSIFSKNNIKKFENNKFPEEFLENNNPILWINNSLLISRKFKDINKILKLYLEQNFDNDVLYLFTYGDQCHLHTKVFEINSLKFVTSYNPKGLQAVLFISEKSKKILKKIINSLKKIKNQKNYESILEKAVYKGKLKAHSIYPFIFYFDYHDSENSVNDIIKINPCDFKFLNQNNNSNSNNNSNNSNDNGNQNFYLLSFITLFVGASVGLYVNYSKKNK